MHIQDLTLDDWLVGQAYRYAQSVGAVNLLQPLLQERQKAVALIQQQQQHPAQHGSAGPDILHHQHGSTSPHAVSPAGPASAPSMGALASSQQEHQHAQQQHLAADNMTRGGSGSIGPASNIARGDQPQTAEHKQLHQGVRLMQSAPLPAAAGMDMTGNAKVGNTTGASPAPDTHAAQQQLHPAIYSGWPTGNAAAADSGSGPAPVDTSPSQGEQSAHAMSPVGHDEHAALEIKKSKGAFSKMCNYLKRKLAS